ncbi:putative cytochrome 82A3-like [Capsicum annuum]|nr:putative cytochrome 82A3-like [Capsicum annuum]
MSSSSNFIKIGLKHLFENLIMTIIVRMLFGKEYDLEGGQRARIAIRKLFKLLGTFVVADFIPSLRWLDIRGYEKKMKENAKETDCILEKWLVEHKRKRSCGELKNEDEKDSMDIMLSLYEGARMKIFLVLMLIPLSNLHAWYSSTIQLVEDSTGSDRLVRTPLYKPERFLTTHKEVDIKGSHFELIPFGAGRRLCPGISSALVLLLLTLANVLHAFEITRPSDESIDMT